MRPTGRWEATTPVARRHMAVGIFRTRILDQRVRTKIVDQRIGVRKPFCECNFFFILQS